MRAPYEIFFSFLGAERNSDMDAQAKYAHMFEIMYILGVAF